MNERKAMLTSQTGLSVTRQCQLLAVPRSSAYARAQPVSSVDLALMRLLDELYLKNGPFMGVGVCVMRCNNEGIVSIASGYDA